MISQVGHSDFIFASKYGRSADSYRAVFVSGRSSAIFPPAAAPLWVATLGAPLDPVCAGAQAASARIAPIPRTRVKEINVDMLASSHGHERRTALVGRRAGCAQLNSLVSHSTVMKRGSLSLSGWH